MQSRFGMIPPSAIVRGASATTLWYAIGVAALATGAICWPQLFPLDDPYITLSNARVMLSGEADSAFQTSYLTGATSPAHLLLVALLGLIVPPVWGSLLLGITGALIYVFALIRVADCLLLSGRRRAAVLAFGALSGYSLIHYLNGLETSLAMAASAWMFLWCDDRRKLPLLAGLAPFVRPELGLFSALLLTRLAFRSTLPQTAVIGLRAAMTCAPFGLWVYAETGHVLPSTILAKYAWFHPESKSLAEGIGTTARALAASLELGCFIGLLGLPKLACGRSALLFVALGPAAMAFVLPEIISWNFGRYVAIFHPILVFGLAAIVARKKLSGLLVHVLFAWTAVTFIIASVTYVSKVNQARQVQEQARFVATLPASSVIMIHDAGQVAWEAPKGRLIYIVGLKTPAVVAVNRRLSDGDCRRQRSLDQIARDYAATHLVVLNRWNWPCVAHDMRRAGWVLKPVYEGLYSVYALTPTRHPERIDGEPNSSPSHTNLPGESNH